MQLVATRAGSTVEFDSSALVLAEKIAAVGRQPTRLDVKEKHDPSREECEEDLIAEILAMRAQAAADRLEPYWEESHGDVILSKIEATMPVTEEASSHETRGTRSDVAAGTVPNDAAPRHNSRSQRQSGRPGAYAVGATRPHGNSITTEGTDEETGEGITATAATVGNLSMANANADLAEARPVEHGTLQQARQVYSNANEHDKKNKWQKPAATLCYVVAAVAVVFSSHVSS